MCMSTEERKASCVGCVWIQPITTRFLDRTVSKMCCKTPVKRLCEFQSGLCAPLRKSNLFTGSLAIIAANENMRLTRSQATIMIRVYNWHRADLFPFCCGTMTVEITNESPVCTPPNMAHVSMFLAVFARAANMNASIAWWGMRTDLMRYGEKSFHELNILEDVCS